MTNDLRKAALAALVFSCPFPVAAQMSSMQMDHAEHQAPATAMPGMDMSGDNHTGKMTMAGEGSGTSRLPGAEGMMHGLHLAQGGWTVMLHGYAWATYSDQGGPRGDSQGFVTSMAMAEASRSLSAWTRLQLRGMFSLDPLIGRRGYPNLFATGETAGGVALVDRQHPHDLFMELSARIETDLGGGISSFVYGGPVAEPALGPSAFMHRRSARFNPEAPITHHWLDSTHITFGVVTAGLSSKTVQVEASAFRGREPDERRWNIETPKLDSWSVRATWRPIEHVAASLSHGRLRSPEVLHPGEDETRTILTLAYADDRLAVTGAYGHKKRLDGRASDAFLAEANWDLTPRHALFGRVESVDNDELFDVGSPLHDRPFRVTKATLGYAYTLPVWPFGLSLGGSGSVYAKPGALDPYYGRAPKSFTLFAKLALEG